MAKSAPAFVIRPSKPFCVYDSNGVWHATVVNFCIWDLQGEYIGFVRGSHHDVYTAHGEWIGCLTADGRVVRERFYEQQPLLELKKLHPPRPRNLPPRAPKAPRATKLDYHYVDVLEWDPDAFRSLPNPKSDLSYDVS
jgi:hypothetical protein